MRVHHPARLLAAATLALLSPIAIAPSAWSEVDRLPGVYLVRPVAGDVVRVFERPASRYGPGHRGVDLKAHVGASVVSGAAGVVTFAGVVADRGVVTVDHGEGVDTTYEPVSATVSPGDRVASGDRLGTVSTNSHVEGLHWGLRRSGTYHDPMLHLFNASTGEIRLLPLDAEPPPLAAAFVSEPPGGAGAIAGGVPVSGPVTSRFGMRLHPILKVWRLHDGVDYGAPCGAPIRAARGGSVVLVDHHVAYGRRVIVDVGGGRRHGYTHLGSVGVGAGQQVPAGGYLGAVGSTGYSTGCHLHFMAWQDGRVVDPT